MRSSPFGFKLATLSEAAEITQFLLDGFQKEWEGNEDLPKPDRESVLEEIELLCKNNGLIKYMNNNLLIGVIGAKIAKAFWWSDKKVMTGVIFYVLKEFRTSNAASRMLSVVEEFAKINAVPLEMCFFGTDLERKTNMLLRRGYKPVSWSVYKNEVRKLETDNYNQSGSSALA